MVTLFNNLNGIWLDYFDKLPGGGGPYIAFVVTLFQAVRAALPPKLRGQFPRLAHSLPATADAARARYRDSAVPKLKRWVERDMATPKAK